MMALIASIPILLVIILMIAFNKPAKVALPIGWAAALVIALLVSLVAFLVAELVKNPPARQETWV